MGLCWPEATTGCLMAGFPLSQWGTGRQWSLRLCWGFHHPARQLSQTPAEPPAPQALPSLGGQLIGHVPLLGLLPCRLGFPLQTLPQAGLTGTRSGTPLSCSRSRPRRRRAGGRGGVWAPFIQVPAEQIGPCPTSGHVPPRPLSGDLGCRRRHLGGHSGHGPRGRRCRSAGCRDRRRVQGARLGPRTPLIIREGTRGPVRYLPAHLLLREKHLLGLWAPVEGISKQSSTCGTHYTSWLENGRDLGFASHGQRIFSWRFSV